MKISLVYPKIPENSNKFFNKCYAFEKLDGTNMHWTWDPDIGWLGFGTRRTHFTLNKDGIADFIQTHPELAEAPGIFNEVLRDKLTMRLCQNSSYHLNHIIIFTEFYGPNSFAGNHFEEDVKSNSQKLTIIDVSINKVLIPPKQFIDDFNQFDIAKLIYSGKYSGQFAEDLKNGKYNVNEGVVVKGIVDGEVFMTKIKTKTYLKRLRQR
jgi:hypothetical protein